MDDWQLRNFLMIVECRSITRAAHRLGMSQPSLSHQLMRLEDELGVPLLHRTTRGVTPTDAGRLFQEHARNLLKTMERIREDLRRHHTTPSGEVVLGLPSSISEMLGVPLLIAARERFPQITLHLREALSRTIRGWLEDGHADLAILYHGETARNLSVKTIADETLFLIGRPTDFGALDDRGIALAPVDAARMAGMQLVLPKVGSGVRRLLDRRTHERGGPQAAGAHIIVDSLSQIRALVALGHGFAVLPHAAVSDDIRSGRLAAARIEGADLRRSVSVVRNPAHTVTRASVEIEDLALSLLGGMIASGQWITAPHDPEARSSHAHLDSELPAGPDDPFDTL